MKKITKKKNPRKTKRLHRARVIGVGLALISLVFFFVKGNNHQLSLVKTVFAGDFSAVISSAGTNPVTVVLTPGTYTVGVGLTVPSNISLRFENGAVVAISNGAALTIQGQIEDTTNQIFDDQNTDLATKGVKFWMIEGISFVRPEWWGAKADDNPTSAAKNSDAIKRALGSMTRKSKVLFSIGKYYINQTIRHPEGTFLVGQGNVRDYNGSSVIRLKDGSNVHMLEELETTPGNHYGYYVNNIRFHGGSQSTTVDGIRYSYRGGNVHWARVRDCGFTNFNGWAMNIGYTGQNMIEGNWVDDSANGLRMDSFDAWVRNNDISATGGNVVELARFYNPFTGNTMNGKNSATNCLYASDKGGDRIMITGNTMKNCVNGAKFSFSPGIFRDNLLENNQDGIFVDGGLWPMGEITKNRIINNSRYGINLSMPYTSAAPSVIRDNIITGNGTGAIHFETNTNFGNREFEPEKYAPLIEDNEGIDVNVGSDYPILRAGGGNLQRGLDPLTFISKRWKTANTSATTISNFESAPPGKEVIIFFGDNNTTIKFSGTTNMRGNAKVDWHPFAGDEMRCKKGETTYPNDESWYCECSDKTP